MSDPLFLLFCIMAGGLIIACIANYFFPFDGRVRARKGERAPTYCSHAQAMSKYPHGVEGFYCAVEEGRVGVDSEDYQRFYVPRVHANYLLYALKGQLRACSRVPKNIELSLARIEGLLAGR